jgi:signal transduction histidine kinase
VRKKGEAEIPRAAFEVLDSAEQAVNLINDLLDLSRLDEDRLKPEFQAVGAIVTARRAISRVIPQAEARQVIVSLEAPPPPVGCWTDVHRLEQILLNLLGNAIRHTPPESTVTIVIELGDGHVEFVVRDQGPGVPEEALERIFDIYETGVEEGHGLGLPLSRRLARLLGGDLQAERPADGGGLFRLTLPIAPIAR